MCMPCMCAYLTNTNTLVQLALVLDFDVYLLAELLPLLLWGT